VDFTPPPMLEPRHLEGCRVLADRDTMIREHLPKYGVVAEVGVAGGGNARTILEGAKPRELHLIDLDLSILQRHLIEPALNDGTARLYESDSFAALASFPDKYFDWIYIDGDHTYPGVKRDIEQAKRTVKPDGLLVFNDYIIFSHLEFTKYGVVHAVNELCVAEDWALRYVALNPQMYCDVVLARQSH
jgi:spermidine synthase